MDWHGDLTPGPPPAVAPTASSIARTIENVSGVLPVLSEAKIAKIWAGLLDLTPDALPVIERVPEIDGIVIAAGFSGHGFGIGPMTSLLVRDLVLGDIGLVIPHNLVCHFIIGVDVEQGDGGPKNDLATGRNRSNIDDLCSR